MRRRNFFLEKGGQDCHGNGRVMTRHCLAMDSDDEEFVMPTRRTRGLQVTSKRAVQQAESGIMGELHSPKHETEFEEPKKKSFLSRVAGGDVSRFSAMEQRMSDQVDTSPIRPMTAVSQSGDLSTAIPSLDELREAGDPAEPVKAPFMAMNNLFSYQELEKDLMKNAAFSTFDDLDFSPLLSRLLPESEVVLEDENWTWDKLVASISSNLPSNNRE